MKTTCLPLLTLAFLFVTAAPAQDDVKKELDRLKGKWTVVSVERDGKALANFKDGVRTMDGEKYTLAPKTGAALMGTFKIDPGKKPKVMDMMPADGQYKGKTLLGIYELDGDTLKICFGEPGKDRPSEFTSTAGTVLAIHKRQK